MIVRGHANLLEDLHALEDLERVRLLFDDLETKRGVIDLLGRAENAEGVRIFIGSENKLFSLPMKIRTPSAVSARPRRSMTPRLVSRSSNRDFTRSRSSSACRSSSRLA